MIDAYKRFPVKYQFLAIIALSGLALLLGWSVDEPWIIGGFVLVTLTLLHLFMAKFNSLLALIAIILQFATYAAMMFAITIYGHEIFPTMGVSHDLAFYGFGCYGLTVTAFYVYLAYKFCRGRMWINLSTAFLLSWMFAFVTLMINPIWMVTALTIGFVAGLVFLLFRFPNRKKKASFKRPTLNKESMATVQSLFREHGLKYCQLNKESSLKGHYFAYNDHSAFLINVVKPTEQFSVTGSGIISDSLNLVPAVENAQQSIILNKKELNPDIVTSVLLVLSPFKNLQAVMSVSVSKWKQPDHMIGITNILTPKGFGRFIRAIEGEMKVLNQDKQDKIKSFVEKLTSK